MPVETLSWQWVAVDRPGRALPMAIEHVTQAVLTIPADLAREVRESDARMTEIESGFGARVVWQGA